MATATSQTKQVQPDFKVEVKTLLLHAGLSVKELAVELGFSCNNVSIAINHPEAAPTMAGRIRDWMKKKRKELGVAA